MEAEQQQEQINKLLKEYCAVDFIDLNFFLPKSKDSWTLSITAHGGFAGVTRLLAAVNSNGNYLCSPRQEFKNRLLEKDVLDHVFDFVETFNFSKLDNNGCEIDRRLYGLRLHDAHSADEKRDFSSHAKQFF